MCNSFMKIQRWSTISIMVMSMFSLSVSNILISMLSLEQNFILKQQQKSSAKCAKGFFMEKIHKSHHILRKKGLTFELTIKGKVIM